MGNNGKFFFNCPCDGCYCQASLTLQQSTGLSSLKICQLVLFFDLNEHLYPVTFLLGKERFRSSFSHKSLHILFVVASSGDTVV